MNSNVQALRALYVVLGGELTDTYEDIANGVPVSDYAVIPDVIMAISKKATSGSGSDLPTVTDDDDGKVLGVSGGAWTKSIATGNHMETLTFSNLNGLADELRFIMRTLLLSELVRCKLVITNAFGVSGLTSVLHLSEFQNGPDGSVYIFVQDPAVDTTGSNFKDGYAIRLDDASITAKGYSFNGSGITLNNDSIVQGNDTGGYLIY